MQLLIFCIILSVSAAFDFDCLKGPDFWCKDFSNAEKCGKITECFMGNNIPEQKKFSQKQPKSDLYCSLCIEIGNLFNQKFDTKEKFIDIINKEICENLEDEIQAVCKLLVSQYGPLVYDKIKTDLSPEIVCKFFKFCDSKSILSRERINNFQKIGSFDVCAKCKEFFQVLQSMFTKITPEEIKFFLDNFLCTQLPGEMQSTCKMLVDGYASQLYELIKTLLDGDRMCPLVYVCNYGVQSSLGSWSCNTCVDVVTVLKKDLINVSESELKNFVKSTMCAKLNFIAKAACNKYVSKLMPSFYKDIHSNQTPQQICSNRMACHFLKPFSHNSIKKVTDVKCDACRLAVGELKKLISEPTKQDAIKQFLKNKVCPMFQLQKIQCQQIVDEYFNIILNLLISEMDVDKICHVMDMCSSNVANVECSVCEAVMNELIPVALSNHTQQVFITFVNSKICPILGHIEDQCVILVNTYSPMLFSMARSTLSGQMLCSKFKLCTVITKQEFKFALENIQNGSMQCEICLFAVNETRLLLKSRIVQIAIQNAIKSLTCSHMSNPQNCIDIINQYFPIILNIIMEYLNPALCTELHLCNSPNSFIKPIQTPNQLNNFKRHNNKECQLCSKFYDYLRSITGRKYHSKGVLGLIDLCNGIDIHDKSKCWEQFQNFNTIVKLFNKSANLGQFCDLTAMCSVGDRTPKQKLGGHSCSWGPAFWCLSEKHASACGPGAVKHCEMKVWNQMPRKL